MLLIAAVLGRGYLQEGRAWYYGLQAYLYGFPLVMMDLTKDQGTAVPTAGEITAPVNQFAVMTKYPDASFRAVPRTGLDTLFATAWADLDKEPLVLSVPDTGGRYYVIALFDMWSNVFTSIGKRNTGTGAASFLIAGPRWQGTPPADVKEVFHSPTRFVWVNGQMQANGPQDYDAVNALQKQYKLTPLGAWGQPYTPPADVPVAAGVDTKTPPAEQVAKMDAGAFFGRLARLMKDNPPAPADAPIVEKLKALGIEPGKDFDIATIDPDTARGLQRAMGAFGLLQKGVTKLNDRERLDRHPKELRQLRHRLRDPSRHRSDRARRNPPGRRRVPHGLPRRRRQAARCREPLRPAFRQGPDAPHQRHLVGVDVRPAGLLRAERHQSLQPREVDAAPVQRRRLARHVHPGELAGSRTRKPTGCPRPRADRSTSPCASTGRRRECSTAPTSFRR